MELLPLIQLQCDQKLQNVRGSAAAGCLSPAKCPKFLGKILKLRNAPANYDGLTYV